MWLGLALALLVGLHSSQGRLLLRLLLAALMLQRLGLLLGLRNNLG